MIRLAFATRVYRAALRVLPRWFRKRYGQEMVVQFDREWHARNARSGVPRALGFLLRALVDLPRAAREARRLGNSSLPPRRRGVSWLDDLAQAARSLRRAPGWTATAVLVLTLGIGGTTLVFSVLNAVLLRPLPYEDPDRLVSLWTVNTVQDLPDGSSWENARDWLERGSSLEEIALVLRPEFTGATVTSFGEPERIHVGLVSAGFFELLGVRPVAGRFFGPSDLDTDARLAVIDEGLWQDRFARDPAALGSALTIDGQEVTIVGVAPHDLTIPRAETAVWRLLDVRTPADADRRHWDAYWVIGRLGPGVDAALAREDLTRVAAELELVHPETNRDRGVSVTPLLDEVVGAELPTLLWTLMASMVLVLLIGATNVAQLLLSRGIDRRRELAVRASLGATRARIGRQLAFEGGLLSVASCVAGVLLAIFGLRAFVALVPTGVPRIEGTSVDPAVLLASVLVAGLVAPLVGLLPVLSASRSEVADALRGGGRGTTGRDRRARSVLVVAEVAMAVLLLGGAGLLTRSALALQAVDPGFDARGTLTARVHLTVPEDGASLVPMHRTLVDRISAHSSVEGVGIIGQFFIERIPDQTITLVGEEPAEPGAPAPRLTTDMVFPGFFHAIDVPVVRGDGFAASAAEQDGPPWSVVVNRAWVDVFSPDQDPIGREFVWGRRAEGDRTTVVGVVDDLRRTTLAEAVYPQMYLPGAVPAIDVLVRTRGNPSEVAPWLRAVVREVDPNAAVSNVGPMWERYSFALAPRRFQMWLVGAFATLATLLASIGLFAILHESVAARRREIGVRVALGAAPADVRTMVVRQAVGLGGLGLAIGLMGLVSISGVSARLVYGIRPTDPATLVGVVAVVITVIGLASGVPAVRAMRVAPAEALEEG